MKKQSGFTLIELMVVMAIIAILATAGLSAYTGYIKKARDTTRIADLAAINTIVLGAIATDGLPPTPDKIVGLIKAANNGQRIVDPLTVGESMTIACSIGLEPVNDGAGTACGYMYFSCDDGTGYQLTARFESTSNFTLYTENNSGPNGDDLLYDIGSCMNSLEIETAVWLDNSL